VSIAQIENREEIFQKNVFGGFLCENGECQQGGTISQERQREGKLGLCAEWESPFNAVGHMGLK
jgi:hypothetical protein